MNYWIGVKNVLTPAVCVLSVVVRDSVVNFVLKFVKDSCRLLVSQVFGNSSEMDFKKFTSGAGAFFSRAKQVRLVWGGLWGQPPTQLGLPGRPRRKTGHPSPPPPRSPLSFRPLLPSLSSPPFPPSP